MKVRKPYFYDEFKCIGSDCMDTCCAGWQIDIDEDTLKKYDAIDGEFGLKLKESILRGDKSNFVLKEDNRCSFLNRDNLCDIYIQVGEDK